MKTEQRIINEDVKSSIPYLRLAMHRYDATVAREFPLHGPGAQEWLDEIELRWQGVQCAVYFVTCNVNRWSHVTILSPCESTIYWIERIIETSGEPYQRDA